MLSVAEAQTQLLAQAPLPTASTNCPLLDCGGRVLATTLASPLDLPHWDHSAMDGYALCLDDLRQHHGKLPIRQRITAGMTSPPLIPQTAARIFTGAPVPAGADTVIVQEAVQATDGILSVAETELTKIKRGANIRRQGEDVRCGAPLLAAGMRLHAQHIALAAAAGLAELPVYKRLRVAMFTTGNELALPGTPLQPGQIYNSNRYLLHSLLTELGCEVIELGGIADSLEHSIAALQQGAASADLIIAAGGVSVGEEDHIRPAIEHCGRLALWQVAMRPGKPVAFGWIDQTPLIGCPGNPVSLFVTFGLFARPLIEAMQGITPTAPLPTRRAAAAFTHTKANPRTIYQSARLQHNNQGQTVVTLFERPSSAAIDGLVWANGLAVIPAGATIQPGDSVEFWGFGDHNDHNDKPRPSGWGL